MLKNLNINPILVTGSHRSGSTWVGKTIASSKNIFYVQEPLNKNNISFYFDTNNTLWFPYITSRNDSIYRTGYNSILKGDLANQFKLTNLKRRSIKTSLSNYIRFRIAKIRGKRFLLKDPFALFSSEWFNQQFSTQNIILIRHPAAFISSLKKNKWYFDFNNINNQPMLVHDHLNNYQKLISDFIENEHDIIDQGILLWNIIHEFILKMKIKHPEWYFVKHENLSRDPINEFKKIFEYLNIPFSQVSEKYIKNTTSTSNESERPDSVVNLIKRNSQSNISNWKKRLDISEIDRIKEGTSSIWPEFYDVNAW